MAEQKTKTKEYWDSFYLALPPTDNQSVPEGNPNTTNAIRNEAPDLEWIVKTDSPELLDTILSLFPSSDNEKDEAKPHGPVNVLEIGCGVSQLSVCLLRRLLLKKHEKDRRAYSFVATDVSPVCIEQNRFRDGAYITSLQNTDDGISYEVLDVLTQNMDNTYKNQYAVIIDKGTLDTFLFRSKRSKKGSESHPPLLTPLLNNVHRMLRSGCEARYIIISPRAKIKSVRDFRGFANVSRMKINTTFLGCSGALEKSNNKQAKQSKSIYVYECSKDESYNPDKDLPYSDSGSNIDDETTCPKCEMSFKDFRGKVNVHDQGEAVWVRRWKNHCVHCK
mmetsp:Transcript_41626/g.71260  ORF Transcript_41626/g.71260 Transcript_41626/m.71260 type:complete len:334 (+) Transcript_41626:237-1238(+)